MCPTPGSKRLPPVPLLPLLHGQQQEGAEQEGQREGGQEGDWQERGREGGGEEECQEGG